MNNIISGFDSEILGFGRKYNLPQTKKRAILREYLQSKILSLIYEKKISKNLFFVGGTSLRLLRNLDRFSEDLDFDVVDISSLSINLLMKDIQKHLADENIDSFLYHNRTLNRDYYELRFPVLLYDLGISKNKDEKLAIKFDFEKWWKGQKRETVFFNRYGFLANIVTKTTNQVLIEKIAAYLGRGKTQPRDIYDIVWLYSKGAKPDLSFAKVNKISSDFLKVAQNKFTKEKKQLPHFKTKLAPFLLSEKNVNKLEYFPKLLTSSRSLRPRR